MNGTTTAEVVAVSRSARHTVRKETANVIALAAGFGVAGDAHAGATVQHRYDKRRDPMRVNRRQVHLIGLALYDAVRANGFTVAPGDLGENITVRGIDLPALPQGTRVFFGADAVVELTGLRHPCDLIDRVEPGLRDATTASINGAPALRDAVMAIVITGGDVRAGDEIRVELPPLPHHVLEPI